ncbi:ankyrin [Bimuria novae-zelandiae CBS 107.79]|uniref:Ankyrin n=1 Tax=Bimuria novae-zelandiae CBS 107.79 TaxID=1447943 RepID=A0A6A5VN29_9PLEO|nr:ankyrin [Bimuria novae-zelandiae CBS 107.79]
MADHPWLDQFLKSDAESLSETTFHPKLYRLAIGTDVRWFLKGVSTHVELLHIMVPDGSSQDATSSHTDLTIKLRNTVSQSPTQRKRLEVRFDFGHIDIDGRALCAWVDLSMSKDSPPVTRKHCFTFYTNRPHKGAWFRAARTNDVELLKAIIASGTATPNDWSTKNRSLLHTAAKEGNRDATLFLLEQGATVHDGYKPVNDILWSIWKGFLDRWSMKEPHSFLATRDLVRYKDVSDLVIEHGASVEFCVNETRTLGNLVHLPCKYICDYGYEVLNTLVQYFVHIGCNIEYRNAYGLTPLLQAAYTGSEKMADYISALLSNGADFGATDPEQHGPLHLAVLAANAKFAQEQKKLKNNDLEEFEHQILTLCEAGCELSATDKYNKTAADYIHDNSLRSFWNTLIVKEVRNAEMPTLRTIPTRMTPCPFTIPEDLDGTYGVEIRVSDTLSEGRVISSFQSVQTIPPPPLL